MGVDCGGEGGGGKAGGESKFESISCRFGDSSRGVRPPIYDRFVVVPSLACQSVCDVGET